MYMTVAPQTWVFLFACLLGGLIGVCFDGFRIIRIAFPPSKVIVFIQDLIFCFIILFFTFLFCQITLNGEIRLFVLVGELLGFVLYYFTIGILVYRFSNFIIRYIKKGIALICRPLKKLLSYGCILLRPIHNFADILKKIFKKILRNIRKMVYNINYPKKWSKKNEKHIRKKKKKKVFDF